MVERTPRGKHVSCPYVNRDDPRCSSRLSLDRIEQAFDVCFGAFHTCPMYHQIGDEFATAEAAARRRPLITVTAHGLAVPLRATGT